MSKRTRSKRPNRAAALAMALLLPTGTGHQYAGLPGRAFGWLAVPLALLLPAVLAIQLGGLGTVSLGFLLVLGPVVWIAPAIDLALIKPDRFKRVPARQVVLFLVISLVAAGFVRLVTRGFMVEAFKIPSASMFPSVYAEDHIWVDKGAYGPVVPFTRFRLFSRLPAKYGDMLVYEYPDPNPTKPRTDFVKRAVAFGGDTLEVENGHPIINGWQVPSCRVGPYELRYEGSTSSGELHVEFLGDHSYLIWLEDDRDPGRQGPYRVKPGETWVLGDNRNNSFDSRAWQAGHGAGVPDELIKGRAASVWLAFEGEDVNGGRIGTDLNGEPWLPGDAPAETVAELRRCMAERPARRIPPPGSRSR